MNGFIQGWGNKEKKMVQIVGLIGIIILASWAAGLFIIGGWLGITSGILCILGTLVIGFVALNC